MPTYDFLITGITCANCTNTIENRLKEFKKIEFTKIQSDITSQVVSVTFEDNVPDPPSEDEIAEWIEDVGFDAELLDHSTPAENKPLPNNHLKILSNKKKLIRQYWIKGIIGILSGAAVMALSMFGMGLPLVVMYLLAAFSSLMTLYLGFESYKKFFYSLKNKELNSMDVLFTMSTSATIILSLAAFALPWLPMMFDAPILIYAFRHIGKAIQEKAKKTEFEQTSFKNRAPALIKKVGVKNKIPIGLIKPGDIIIVRSGEIIPLDGICLTEKTSLLTTIQDGATEPREITKGENLLAGMVVPKEIKLIKMKVTHNESDSNLAVMENSVKFNDSDEKKAKLQKTAEKILKYFVPGVIILGITFGIALSFFFPPIAAIQCAIAILTSVCPCTFGLITPLAITMAKAKAVANGFQFASGNALQKAKEIDTVIFDLNGTLTVGKCTVVQHTIPKDLMRYLQALESGKRTHLIGRALYHYAKSQSGNQDDLACQYTNKYPLLVSATIDNHDYTIGNADRMQKSGFDIRPFADKVKNIDAEHIVYFAKDKKIVGYAALEDPLRPEAKEVIQQLKQMGKKVFICTGSNEKTASIYAKKLKISSNRIFYNCLPDSKDLDANTKTKHILRLKAEGHKIAMIGDGGNDAPAIQESHFGIAMKSSASDPVTLALADAIIQEGSLWPIITAFNIAENAVKNIQQNLLISLSYNLLSIVIISVVFTTIGFALNPAFGALLMILQTGFILANAERFRRQATPIPPNFQPSCNENPIKNSHARMMSNKLRNKNVLDDDHSLDYTTSAIKPIFTPSSRASAHENPTSHVARCSM